MYITLKINNMRWFLFIICMFSGNLYAQSPIEFCYTEQGKVQCGTDSEFSVVSVLAMINAADTIKDDKDKKLFLACCYYQLGRYYHNKEDDFIKAIYHDKKAIDIREQHDDGLLGKAYRNLGYAYIEAGYYEQGIEAILKAHEHDDRLKIQSSTYDYLSRAYSELGEYEKAIAAAEKAITLASSDTKGDAHNVLSDVLIKTRDSLNLTKAIEQADKAIVSYNLRANMARAYNTKGNALMWLGRYDEAIAAYKDALELYAKTNLIDYARTLNNIATVFYAKKEYSKAIDTLNRSLKLKRSFHKNVDFHKDFAVNYENLAENYEGLGDFNKAFDNYQQASINLTNNFRTPDITQNPKLNDSLYVFSITQLIRVLHQKAELSFKIYKKDKKNNKRYLDLAEKTYNTAFDFHDKLQQQINTQQSRLFHAETIVPLIENALTVAYQVQQTQQKTPETAYRFMEKNKATVLMQAINEKGALQYAGLPDSLLKREEYLRISITNYEKQLYDAKQEQVKQRIKNTQSELKEEYARHIKNLENNHPEYYNFKYKQNTTTLKDAQNYLDSETALLEYFVGDSSVYVLTIEKNNARLHRLDKPEEWDEILNEFRQSIIDKTCHRYIELFTSDAHQLYQWLLKEPLNSLKINVKRLQIIPDAQLNYLSFGLLIDTVPSNCNYRNLPYLLKEKSVSYTYSTTLLIENQNQDRQKAAYLYGGFAPKYNYERDKQLDLPDAYANVERQATRFKCEPFLADKATKKQFIDRACQFQILHLAMHGLLDDENPLYSNLIFANNEPLHAADLYNTRLNADLAILSACNTGTGEIKKGEGVMSLSRAFTYAGCPSLLMSLWEVPDASTAIMMNTFLEQLQQGMTKDKALQTAQLIYLNEASSDRLHPAHWAGFVPSGDMQAVKFSRTSNWWWLSILMLFMVVVYVGKRASR